MSYKQRIIIILISYLIFNIDKLYSEEDRIVSLETTWVKSYLQFKGYIETENRFIFYDPKGDAQFNRNENTFNLGVIANIHPQVRGNASIDLVFTGFSDTNKLDDIFAKEKVDTFRIESDEIFFDLLNFPVKNCDIRIGKQIVNWGTADQFNPTNNLSPGNLSDPGEFGKGMSNNMIRFDYYFKRLTFTGVFVPVFKPAWLPKTTISAFQNSPQSQKLFSNTLETLQAGQISPELQGIFPEETNIIFSDDAVYNLDINILTPTPSIENSMVGAKVAWRLLSFDFSLSYFYGRDDLPFISKADITGVKLAQENGIVKITEGDKIKELDLTLSQIDGTIYLTYPKYHVLGIDTAGSIDGINIGIWGEAGIFFPEKLNQIVSVSGTDSNLEPTTIKEVESPFLDSPFVKYTVGIDRTFGSKLYFNTQFIHGFLDELGDDYINNYVFSGIDRRAFNDDVSFRIFGGINIEDKSIVILPMIRYDPFDAVQIRLGSVIFVGDSDTKFGQPTTNKDFVYLKARFSF